MACASAPAGGFATSGNPTFGKPQRFRRVGHQLVSGAGHAGGTKHRFHAGLVAYVERGLHIHAIKSEQFPCVRHGHLQLFQRADEALDGPHLLAEATYRSNQLLWIEGVIHPPMPVQVLLRSGDSRSAGSVVMTARLTPGTCGSGNEPRGCGEEEGCDEGGDHHRQDVTR